MSHAHAARPWDLVIFDHDGVLVDSEILSMTVLTDLVRRYGADISVDHAVAHYSGLTWDETMDEVLPPDVDVDRTALQAEYHHELFSRFESELMPLPGITQLLDDLVAAGIPLAIGSGASERRVSLGIGSTGLAGHFPHDLVVTRDDVPAPKPSPDVFLLAAQRTGASVDRCLVIDDSPQGVEAAHRAGMKVVGLAYRTSRTRLAEADWIVDIIDDVRPLIFDVDPLQKGSTMQTVHGLPSISISSDQVTAYITAHAGAVGPVTFHSGGVDVAPYSLAPWLPGEIAGLDPLLDGLRGDFLCLPFGSPEGVVAHGAVANDTWSIDDTTALSVTLSIDATDVGADVSKTVTVRNGQPALYQEFTVSGLDGEFPYGTHPIIDVSAQPVGSARISTSPMRWQGVCPGWFSVPERDETQILQPDATFTDLASIPALDGASVDLSRYPTPVAHEDLVMLVNDPDVGPLGWSAVSCPDFIWFSLKDVRLLPATLLWVSNGGRRAEPWSGRHVGRLGVEDVCSYFALGVEPSRANPLRAMGVPTVRRFSSDQPTMFRVVQAAVAAPAGFGRVATITSNADESVTLTDDAGLSLTVPVDWRWVLTAS